MPRPAPDAVTGHSTRIRLWRQARAEKSVGVMILNRKNIHRLAIQPYRLLADGFESGDLSAWSVAIQ
jgi:hypothetical protein